MILNTGDRVNSKMQISKTPDANQMLSSLIRHFHVLASRCG